MSGDLYLSPLKTCEWDSDKPGGQILFQERPIMLFVLYRKNIFFKVEKVQGSRKMIGWKIKSICWRLLKETLTKKTNICYCGFWILIFKVKTTAKSLYLGGKLFKENCRKAPVNALKTELAISLEIFFSNLMTFILQQYDGSWGIVEEKRTKALAKEGSE